jgi:hypothetical protein
MPRSSDDDAPRWELPVWEAPGASPLDAVHRWEPEVQAQRRQPRRATATAPARVRPSAAVAPVPPSASSSSRAGPLAWWAAHPWVVLWTLVGLAPAGAVLLRALDEAELEAVVQPLAWALGALFVMALALAMVVSARRSALRLTLGTLTAIASLGMLLWPMTQVTLGRTVCPARAGADLGASVAAAAIDSWQHGLAGDAAWVRGQAESGWRARSSSIRVMEYRLVETGCWERVAPIDGTRTWHEFRVTVGGTETALLSKSVVVHTAVGADGWKITAVEGPFP